MSRSKALDAGIRINRQRLSMPIVEQWVRKTIGRPIEFAEAGLSHDIDLAVRRLLRQRRPNRDGELMVTRSELEYGTAVQSYFTKHSEIRFYTFLPHSIDAGALILSATDLAVNATELLRRDGDAVYGVSLAERDIFSLDRTVEPASVVWELFHFTVEPHDLRSIPDGTRA